MLSQSWYNMAALKSTLWPSEQLKKRNLKWWFSQNVCGKSHISSWVINNQTPYHSKGFKYLSEITRMGNLFGMGFRSQEIRRAARLCLHWGWPPCLRCVTYIQSLWQYRHLSSSSALALLWANETPSSNSYDFMGCTAILYIFDPVH